MLNIRGYCARGQQPQEVPSSYASAKQPGRFPLPQQQKAAPKPIWKNAELMQSVPYNINTRPACLTDVHTSAISILRVFPGLLIFIPSEPSCSMQQGVE